MTPETTDTVTPQTVQFVDECVLFKCNMFHKILPFQCMSITYIPVSCSKTVGKSMFPPSAISTQTTSSL